MANEKSDENVTMSRWELEKEREHAVISAKLKQLDELIPQVHEAMKKLDDKVSSIPMDILTCKETMERSQRQYMHNEFVTTTELKLFESKLEKSISEDFASVNRKIGRASWVVSGFIMAATGIFYILSHSNLVIS